MGVALYPDLVVNGQAIPQSVIASEVQHHEAPKGKPGIAWRKAANAIAVRTLLLQEARKRELEADVQELAPNRFETNEEALIRGLLETTVSIDKPSDTEIHAEWARDPGRFRSPPLWEVSHILFSCDPRKEESKRVAYARASQVLEVLCSGKASFPILAEEHSDCGSKSSGGALGQLGPIDTVPEFEAVLRHLPEGEVTKEPVLTRHGWHIIRMDAVADGQVLPFEAVKGHIAKAMEKAAWAKASRDLIDNLIAKAEISGADFQAVSA